MNKNGLVYLCGPISNISYAESVDWRQQFTDILSPHGIETLSPMRGKGYLKDVQSLSQLGYGSTMSNAHSITTRDRFDTVRADMIVSNLLGAEKVSIGSMIEFGWADLSRVPVLLIMENEGNPHEHGMVTDIAGWRVDTVEEAIHVIKGVLIGGQYE